MVKVEVSDINDNIPEFKPTEYKTKIRSRFPVGVTFITVFANDKDDQRAGKVIYNLAEGNEEAIFNINPESGDISLAKPLPRNHKDSYYVSVEAKDGFGLKSAKKAFVEIGVDDNDITFNEPQYKFTISEDISPYSTFDKIDVKDSENTELSIVNSNVDRYVSIDAKSGNLRTEARMDHETNPVILLNIKSDNYALRSTSYCQVLIYVEDVNDNAPEFEGSSTAMATVKENFSVGDVIFVAKATDRDTGLSGKIEYSLKQNDGGKFRIDPNSGKLFLEKALDYEDKQEHFVLIEAKDQGIPRLSSILKLQILVHDINDNEPKFQQNFFKVELSESHPIDTPIMTFQARDQDSGRNGRVTYTLSENQYVRITQNSGVLILKNALDREFKDSLELTLTAKDHGTPSMSSTVTIQLIVADRNDNSPRFEKRSYKFSVLENLTPGTFVGQVTAQDKDQGENGNVVYNFKTPITDFIIDRTTGSISTGKKLDREETDEYELLVEATDHGRPRRSSEVVVKIHLEDVNDNAPMLIEPRDGNLYVRKNSVSGSLIGRILVKDKDLQNGKLTFQVTGKYFF